MNDLIKQLNELNIFDFKKVLKESIKLKSIEVNKVEMIDVLASLIEEDYKTICQLCDSLTSRQCSHCDHCD